MPNAGMGPQGDDGLVPRKWTAVAPSDVTDLTDIANKGLYVSVAGSLVMQGVDSAAAVTVAVVAGQYMYGNFKLVKAATTATVIALGG